MGFSSQACGVANEDDDDAILLLLDEYLAGFEQEHADDPSGVEPDPPDELEDGPPFHPPPLPPPAAPVPVAAAAAGSGGAAVAVARAPFIRGDPWARYEIPGLGYLVLDEKANSLNAHCAAHGSLCRLNRSLNSNDRRPAQGRPVGQLIAWLQCQGSFADAAAHKASARQEAFVGWATRFEARTWAKALPDFEEQILPLERPLARGEREEPFALPG